MTEQNMTESEKPTKHREITWKGILVGFSSGALVVSIFALIMIVSIKKEILDYKIESIKLTKELNKYRPMVDKSVLPLSRYNEFIEKLKYAELDAERQDIITYYHPWYSDPEEYRNNWLSSYRLLRSRLWKEIEGYEKNNPGEYLRQVIRLGLWSKIIGEKRDAQDAFAIVVDYIDEKPYRIQQYINSGVFDPAYIELGYAEKYKMPAHIDEEKHQEIFDILYQWDGEWVKPEKLAELKKIELKVTPPNK
ncbi:MAG: hypothetical protein K8S87_05905 [Planctomycetes bacterium]|nr:hypothetical protein [Planctomycetota bacterium]